MAVRFNCPIYTYEFILETAGMIREGEEEEEEGTQKKRPSRARKEAPSIKNMQVTDLEELLEKVLEEEDYEQAAKIRDEMNRREQEQ